MTANIVLGLGFGDEGKGKTVNYLLKYSRNPIAIRFSGGSQAGHTVQLEDGTRHVHRNFASGAVEGYPSYFTEHTCIDPIQILAEASEFKNVPELIVHPKAALITPYDIEVNQRRAKRDTCGMGIGETMKRQEQSPWKLYAVDIMNPDMLELKLRRLHFYYGFEISDSVIEMYVDSCNTLLEGNFFSMKRYDYLKQFDTRVFEGSQGILLDRDYGFFPHVTYASTTSKNAFEVCKAIGIDRVTVHYVTRAYQTRHGEGPMFETPEISIDNPYEHNQFNEMQGPFKVKQFAPHGAIAALSYDGTEHPLEMDISRILYVTCTDLVEPKDFPKDYFDLLCSAVDYVKYSDTPESKFKNYHKHEFFGRSISESKESN